MLRIISKDAQTKSGNSNQSKKASNLDTLINNDPRIKLMKLKLKLRTLSKS